MKNLIYKVMFIVGGIAFVISISSIVIFNRVYFPEISSQDIVFSLIYPTFYIFAAYSVVCGVSAFFLSKHIIKGIEKINPEQPNSDDTFKELDFLVKHINEQNKLLFLQNEKLKASKKEFFTITDNMSEGFLLVDNKMQIISYNRSAVKFLCEQSDEKLVLSQCDNDVINGVTQALAGQRTENIISRDEECFEVISSPVVRHGQVVGAVVIVMDVTEKQQREILRREFTANVSHELKTPLTSISGFAELMREGFVSGEKVKEFSEDIYNEARRLLELVNDILRLSMLDEGGVVLETEEVDLFELCEATVRELSSVADKTDVKISVEGEHICINGVKNILCEMVYNLCDNAIKYNVKGGNVHINVGKNGFGNTYISVSDTGIGIPNSHQSRVFERFYRVDKSHSKAVGGTGLGLSIVKHAAAFHKACVTLKSEVGVGTEITVVFGKI